MQKIVNWENCEKLQTNLTLRWKIDVNLKFKKLKLVKEVKIDVNQLKEIKKCFFIGIIIFT